MIVWTNATQNILELEKLTSHEIETTPGSLTTTNPGNRFQNPESEFLELANLIKQIKTAKKQRQVEIWKVESIEIGMLLNQL